MAVISTPLERCKKLLVKPMFDMGLQKLLLYFFTGVALIPILFLGTWIQHNALATEVQAVQEEHLLLADNISSTLSRYAKDLEAVFIAKSEAKPAPFSPEIETLLRAVDIQMLAIYMDNQFNYCMGNASFMPAGGIDDLQVEKAQALRRPNATVISPVVFDTQSEPTLYLLRVTQANHLAIAAVSTNYFKQQQQRIAFGELGHAAIVDHTGQVIAHPSQKWQQEAHNISNLAPVKRMLEGKTGVEQFYSPVLKAKMIAGYSFVPETGWGVMVPQPYSEIQALARQTKLAALLVAGLGLLLAVFISWRVTVYVLNPIRRVISASKALAQGKQIRGLTLRSEPLPREISNLLYAFDQMAEEVSLARATLECRVEARTQALVKEVERRRQLEQKLIEQATHDVLTGLPNRRLLSEQLPTTIANSQVTCCSIALLFLDLDGFKKVNDTYGHRVGDELLIQVANRLRSTLRKTDSVFRLGGDEFVVLAEKIESVETARSLAEDLLETIQMPFMLENQVLTIGGSIGIKISNNCHPENARDLLAAADEAMYRAKVRGNCAMML